MQIIFDTTIQQDRTLLEKLFKNLEFNLLQPERDAQPEVASNTGTTATGVSSLSPVGGGVDEGAATAAAPVTETAKQDREKPKRGRPAKTEKVEVVTGQEWAAAAQATEPEPAEPTPVLADPATFTLDEVRAALQQFTAAKGVPAGIELLKKFNAGRISELAEDAYASFVAECQA